MNKIKVQQKVR